MTLMTRMVCAAGGRPGRPGDVAGVHAGAGYHRLRGCHPIRLGGDGHVRGVLGRHHGAPVGIGEGGLKQLSDDGLGAVAVGLFDKQTILEFTIISQVSQRVLSRLLLRSLKGHVSRRFIYEPGSILIKISCLSNEIE